MGRSIPPRYDPYKIETKKKRKHRPPIRRPSTPKRRFKPRVKQRPRLVRKIPKLVKEILAKG